MLGHFCKQICPWYILACCGNLKQPTIQTVPILTVSPPATSTQGKPVCFIFTPSSELVTLNSAWCWRNSVRKSWCHCADFWHQNENYKNWFAPFCLLPFPHPAAAASPTAVGLRALYVEGPNQNGVSQAWYIVEIHHSGRETSIWYLVTFSGIVCLCLWERESVWMCVPHCHSSLFFVWVQDKLGKNVWWSAALQITSVMAWDTVFKSEKISASNKPLQYFLQCGGKC